jgi:hypothetical protein
MKGPRRRRRRSTTQWLDVQRRINQRMSQHPVPWGLLVICGVLYVAIGLILASFPIAPWFWGIAVLAIIIQLLALGGPKALQRFKALPANLVALGSIVGASGLAVVLSVALNHLGTDQLDDLSIASAILEVFFFSLLALVLAALTAFVTARLGDILLKRVTPPQASLILVFTCLLSLGLGAALGQIS